MNVRPKYPLYLPVFFRPGWDLSKKINSLVPQLLTESQMQQLNSVEGSTNLRECATLFYLAYSSSKNPNGRIVEIGSFKGKSTCWIAKALQMANSNEKVVAVDPCIESSFDTLLNNLKKSQLTQYVETVQQKSEDAMKNWKYPVKLIFIDGSHRYDDVMLDLKLWEPWVNVNGIIAMHDTERTGSRVEVRKAMLDYIVKSKRFKILLELKNMTCFTKMASA
jgi:MMP 1-O-methyltransferase